MPSRQPDQQIRWPIVRQNWRDVAFLHWRYPGAAVAQHLPPGFAVDTFDGVAWVGLSVEFGQPEPHICR